MAKYLRVALWLTALAGIPAVAVAGFRMGRRQRDASQVTAANAADENCPVQIVDLPIEGYRVTSVDALFGGATLTFELPGKRSATRVSARLGFIDDATLDGSVVDMQRLAALADVIVDSAKSVAGALTVEFVGGRKLQVDPLPAAEAWDLSVSAGKAREFVCCPGGEVVVFREPGLVGRVAARFGWIVEWERGRG